jgi:hypothetical protein
MKNICISLCVYIDLEASPIITTAAQRELPTGCKALITSHLVSIVKLAITTP